MTFNPQQIRDAYKKLSPERQNFVMDPETTELISAIFEENGVPEETRDLADNEVLYSMFGLQSLEIAISNIQSSVALTKENLDRLRSNLEEKVFAKINAIGAAPEKTEERTPATLSTPKPEAKQSISAPAPRNLDGVGDSFTQAIVNQAKSLQPIGFVPKNLPTEDSGGATPSIPAPETTGHTEHYAQGKDPYREPIE